MPTSHTLSHENDDFPYEIRDMLFGLSGKRTHRAVFTIIGKRIVILTVRHHSQDRISPVDVEPFQ